MTANRFMGHLPMAKMLRWALPHRQRARLRRPAYEHAARECRDPLPILPSREANLQDAPRLVAQLVGLERRVGRSGKDQITCSPHGHDDVATAAAGALVHAAAWGDQLMLADWGDRARRERAGDLPAWTCPTCRGERGTNGRCPRCDRPLWTWEQLSRGF